MKIVVIGGTGLIGSKTCKGRRERLARGGDDDPDQAAAVILRWV